jgi:hypothetical protein
LLKIEEVEVLLHILPLKKVAKVRNQQAIRNEESNIDLTAPATSPTAHEQLELATPS